MHFTKLVKTPQQAAPAGHASRTTPTIEYMLRVNRENGPRALYRGFGWNVFGGIPSEAAHYVAYHQTKVWMLQTRTGARNPSLVYVAAGTLAEIVSVGLWVPFDVISQRLQLQGTQRAAAAAAAAAARRRCQRRPPSRRRRCRRRPPRLRRCPPPGRPEYRWRGGLLRPRASSGCGAAPARRWRRWRRSRGVVVDARAGEGCDGPPPRLEREGTPC